MIGTKEQLVDYIYNNFTRRGKRSLKKNLNYIHIKNLKN